MTAAAARPAVESAVGIDISPITAGQKTLLESGADSVLLSGAFGAGKSYIGCKKGLMLSFLYPGSRGLITRKTFASLRHTTLHTLFTQVLPPGMIRGHNKNDHLIVLHTPDPDRHSEIIYEGINNPTRIGSMNLSWVFADEGIEVEEADWTMLEGRLRWGEVPFHQIFSATNPAAPSHFLYRMFYDAADRPRRDQAATCAESNALENWTNPESFRRRLARFKGKFYDRFVLGKWVGFEGLIYADFSPSRHIDRNPPPIPAEWPRHIVIDFGYIHPACVQWWAVDPDADQRRMYREIYHTRLTTQQLAAMILKHSAGEPLPKWIATDHDADARASMQAAWRNPPVDLPADVRTFAREFCRVPFLLAEKDVSEGIKEVTRVLGSSVAVDDQEQDGLPLALFHEGALCHPPDQHLAELDPPLPCQTTDEFGGYMWGKDAMGNFTGVPDKKRGRDDGMDATRYFHYTLEVLRGRPKRSRVVEMVIG